MAFVLVVPLVLIMGGVIRPFRAFVVASAVLVLIMGGAISVFVMGGVSRVFAMGGVVRRQAGMALGVLILRMLVGGVVVHVHAILARPGLIRSGCRP